MYLKARGLYSEELKFFLPIKKQQLKSKVLMQYTEQETDKIPFLLSQKEREKLQQRLQDEEEDREITKIKDAEKAEKIENLRKLREEIEIKHKLLEDIEKQNNDILQCFKGSVCASLELELNTTYYITAFKVTKNNYYIIYAYTEQEENKIFSLFYAPPLIKKILEGIDKICVRDCGNNTYCNTSTYKDYLIVFTPEKYEYKNNNKYVRIGQYKTFSDP